jgi:hypothetical protein
VTRYPKGTTVVYNGIDAVVLCEYPESVYIKIDGEIINVKHDQVKQVINNKNK